MKLIDKDKLEAFLNELIENLGDSDYDRGYLCAIDSIFGCYLNTLEVKEVDLEEEIDRVWDNTSDNFSEDGWKEFEDIAKHFFELGLKVAQKV